MLTKKKQRKFLAKKNKEWQTYLQAYNDSRDPEALHQLRLALKKLHAVARFSKACCGGQALKDFQHGLQDMFKQAGIIRDAGNHLQLLEHFHTIPTTYVHQQAQLQAVAIAEFTGQVKAFRRRGIRAAKRLLSHVQPVTIDCIRDWYAKQLISTGILLTASGDDLHEARKQIKDLLYILKLLPSEATAQLRLDADYLDQLQEAIGQWHDAVVIAAIWADRDLEGSPAMALECREKEAAVQRLAENFYLRVHLPRISSPG
ncbi:CHAD domain-containing protein [Puia dinghuensis]|uniref:CHAD domain-containing protein n=1 Tax=Puia dinghuensis TaxID=1792502 RepID=A0A8J2XSZ7_9BACT|nr:CHAD domain-containing protein [Puia dinghuensis]GGA99219.1 hypothetical protein GCM10011511_23160 [Puia dinghuensis]